MSRSKRKTPIVGVTTMPSDKPFKKQEHQRERSAVKAKLKHTVDGDSLPPSKAFGDPWKGEKDGKQYLPDGERKDLKK